MSNSLSGHLLNVAEKSEPLWINGWDYGQKLLIKGGTAKWDDVGAFAMFHKQLQGLLKSDVLTIDIMAFFDFWLALHQDLLTQMAAKGRLGFALRTLLADASARSQLHEIVQAICESNKSTPVLLDMSAPRSWMSEAHCLAQKKTSAEVTWDDAESASMYMADFLRHFSDCPLSGILLRDKEGWGPASENDISRYQPVFNVAQHYNWEVVFDGCEDDFLASPEQGINLCLGVQGSNAQGQKLPGSYVMANQAAPIPTEGQFFYVSIPQDAVPETALVVLEKLRKKAGTD